MEWTASCWLLVSSESDSAALAPLQQDFLRIERTGRPWPVHTRDAAVRAGKPT
jgi:hypothetical protein